MTHPTSAIISEKAVVGFMRALLRDCETAAREERYVGDDWEPTRHDCDTICDQVYAQAGRWPTRAEWGAAGWPHVGNAHVAGGPRDPLALSL